MKFLLLSALVALCAVTRVWCQEIDPKEEADYWSSNRIQDGWFPNSPLREILLRMTRKPRPHQFIGLMGKRSMANAQITHKRHKINSFVGLMGKRSQEEPGESVETDPPPPPFPHRHLPTLHHLHDNQIKNF
uniref:Tachykinin precursor 1 n=1 Tax=Takifugu rubripes TaxID=31033 RepID=A0A674PRN8_TAKRU